MEGISVKITPDGERTQRLIDELKMTKLYVGFKAGEHFEENGIDVAEVALRNEFGDDNIPSRPFMSQTYEKHDSEIIKLTKDAFANNDNAHDILRAIGEGIAGLMKAEIDSGEFAPNAPSTIARKGSNKPLIDTGTMRDSIEFWTEKG